MSFELSPRETFAENVVRLVCRQLDGVLATLAADPPHASTVHGARKDLKRTRALLRLARTGLEKTTFQRENAACRDAGRALSAARDAQVLVGAFEDLKDELHGRVAPEMLASVHAHLLEGVRAGERSLREEGGLSRAAALLQAVRGRAEEWPWRQADNTWRVPGGGLKRVYRAARRAMRRAAAGTAEGDFHEWRKQVKHLGAHVRLLRPLRPGKFEALGKKLDRLAARLGDEHDLAVLADTLARPAAALPSADLAAIGRAIDERRAALRHRALKLGRRIFRARPRRFARRWRGCWEAWNASDTRPAA